MKGLDRKLADWEAAGLLTAPQVAAILTHEGDGDGDAPARRITVAMEALGYVGATLALSAVSLVLGEYWETLGTPGQLAIIGALSGLLMLAGALVRDVSEPAVARLGSVLWFASTVGVAWLVGVLGDEVIGLEWDATTLVVGSSVVVQGGVLWWLRRRTLQHLAVFAGVSTSIGGLLALADLELEPFAFGLTTWGLGAVWALLAHAELLPPRPVGYVLGILALGVGAELTSVGDYRTAGLLLALATTAVVLGAGILRREVVLLGLGAVGIVAFVPQLIFHLFADTLGAPLLLFVVGVVLVGTAVAGVQVKREVIDTGPAA